MISDNPAARLLAILEKGNNQDSNKGCRSVWQLLLGVEEGNEALLISRIGKVMELPEQVIIILGKDFPNQSL